jgi:flavin-binding protein dodecin
MDQYGFIHCVRGEDVMTVYRVIDVIGTSPSSWEEAAAEAINTASGSLRDLRVAEVTKQDVVVGDDGGLVYRTKIQLSFKYESD